MLDLHVLVIGTPQATSPVVRALRRRGLRAWSEPLGRALTDGVSLPWADALVVIDDDPESVRHLRGITDFDGPRLLAALDDAPAGGVVADLLESGFDFALPSSTHPSHIAALVARSLRMPVRWAPITAWQPRLLSA